MDVKNIIVEDETGECIGWDEFNQLVYKQRLSYDNGKTFEPGGWKYTFVRDYRNKICAICGRGWETTIESMTDAYMAHDKHVHYSCYERHLGFQQRGFIYNAVCSHHFPLEIFEIDNEYRGAWNTPWYLIKILKQVDGKNFPTPFIIKYGSRKRVCEVKLQTSDESMKLKPTPILVEMGANVTKAFEDDYLMIHTYNDEDTKKVLTEFAEILKDYGI